MLKIRKNEESHQVNWLMKMMFGQQSDYTFVTLYDYTFSGNDIVVEEYTGNEPNRGTKMRYNLADVVYDINSNLPVKNDEQKGTTEFYEYSSNQKITSTVAELRDEVEKHNIVTKKFILGIAKIASYCTLILPVIFKVVENHYKKINDIYQKLDTGAYYCQK